MVLDGSESPSNLAAPQCVASLGVRLDLHGIAPSPWIFTDSVTVLAFSSARFGKPLRLAAPHCVAGSGVRLDLHVFAPFAIFY
jgi:hypothetical protein